jgi:hypothetical protein
MGDRPKMAAEAAEAVDLFVPYFRRGGMGGEGGGVSLLSVRNAYSNRQRTKKKDRIVRQHSSVS